MDNRDFSRVAGNEREKELSEGTRFEHWCRCVNYLGSKLFNAGEVILQVKSDWNNEINLIG